MTQKYPKLD